MNAFGACAVALGLVVCGACSVGEPLVDRFPQTNGGGDAVRCTMPPECAVPFEPKLAQPVAKPLEWQRCPRTCGANDGLGPIDMAAELSSIDCVPIESVEGLARDHICVNARFTAPGQAPPLSAAGDLRIDSVTWRSANLAIESDRSLEIVISNSTLRGVRIDLRGPITLRFQDGTTLEGAQLSSRTRGALVAFDRVAPKELVMGDEAQRFAGHVAARHSSFTASSFVLESFDLDSATIEGTFLSSEALIANDGALHDVTMELGDATFAPTALRTVDIARCKTLSFFGSNLQNVVVPQCSGGEPTRLYATDFTGGRLDGQVSGDTGKYEQVLFGQADATDLELWEVRVVSSAFCGRARTVAVSENAVSCSTCSDDARARLEDAACTLPLGGFQPPEDREGDGPNNFCAPLDMPEPCAAPVPTRARPVL